MVMIRAVVRPEKSADVMRALQDTGYPAITKIEVFGRGKQQGLMLGKVLYDELPKEMLLLVVQTILASARTGNQGAYGDGKIFVSAVDEVYTISSGQKDFY